MAPALPYKISDARNSLQYRGEFETGAKALGLGSAKKPIHEQQYAIADVINATGGDGLAVWTTVGVCVPRRASKTTSIFALALGRCLEREDYAVAYSAQTGTKARDRFLIDIVRPLERMFPDEDSRPFKINRSRGGEHIAFDNGSRFAVLPPIADSFRGDAYDLVILDEAQVHEPDASDDLLGAILPTFDTRPGAQLIVAGTTGEHRSGMLWATLQDGRDGRASTGIVEYSAGDSLTEEEMADEAVWRRAHPGIGTLTTIDAIRRNYEKLPLDQFSREYLGVWPAGGGGRFLNGEKWANAGRGGDLPTPPAHFALGLAVHPDQLSASIVAAWRDDAGHAHVLVLDHRPGVRWVATRAVELARKYGVKIGHDTFGPVLVETEAMGRAKPAPRTAPQTMADVKTSAATLVKALEQGELVHYEQDEMSEAARLAVKRKIGNGWGLGRGTPEDDITALEAASYALHVYDGTRQRRPMYTGIAA
ncbi:phage terminase large subunit-like protein [Frigoribacterium sp. PvP054]|uniref:hypothetical protein n=1 Tax=Frigoribacterium sp. PvP054 TaxID=3156438 RepID=UPI0033953227